VLKAASSQLSLQVAQTAPAGAPATGLQVSTSQQNGVLADLYNAQGALLASGKSIIDMRTFPAGTFYLRVYSPFVPQGSTASLAFNLAINPPAQGQTHPIPDNDVLNGGEGNDIIIGNGGLDQISGGEGNNVLVAEPTEVTDFNAANDTLVSPLPTQLVVKTNLPATLDQPVTFDQPKLEQAVARALGIPVTTYWDGSIHPATPITDGEMAELTHLDLSNLGLTDLTGLQYATNLSFLNLNNNTAAIADLDNLNPAIAGGSVFVPGTDNFKQPYGLTQLQFLTLDFDYYFTSFADLSTLTQLKALSIDESLGFYPLFVNWNLSALSGLTGLQFLSLDFSVPGGRTVQDVTPLANLHHLAYLSLRNQDVSNIQS